MENDKAAGLVGLWGDGLRSVQRGVPLVIILHTIIIVVPF